MPAFAVRFKGMLTKDERERLATAGLEITGSESSKVGGTIGIGRPIYTLTAEAATADDALTRVREAIEPDTANFSDWEVELAAG
jgi:hypothetical protein